MLSKQQACGPELVYSQPVTNWVASLENLKGVADSPHALRTLPVAEHCRSCRTCVRCGRCEQVLAALEVLQPQSTPNLWSLMTSRILKPVPTLHCPVQNPIQSGASDLLRLQQPGQEIAAKALLSQRSTLQPMRVLFALSDQTLLHCHPHHTCLKRREILQGKLRRRTAQLTTSEMSNCCLHCSLLLQPSHSSCATV